MSSRHFALTLSAGLNWKKSHVLDNHSVDLAIVLKWRATDFRNHRFLCFFSRYCFYIVAGIKSNCSIPIIKYKVIFVNYSRSDFNYTVMSHSINLIIKEMAPGKFIFGQVNL